MKLGVSRSDVNVTKLKTYGVTGEAFDIKGRQSVSFEVDGSEFKRTFLYVSSPRIRQAC